MAKRKGTRWQWGLGSLGLALAGWGGMLYLTYAMPPNPTTLPLFFAILLVAGTFTAFPVALLIDGRIPRAGRRRSLWRPLRQGFWFAAWVALCAWLQLIQLLDWLTAILFLAIFVLIEWLILSRK